MRIARNHCYIQIHWTLYALALIVIAIFFGWTASEVVIQFGNYFTRSLPMLKCAQRSIVAIASKQWNSKCTVNFRQDFQCGLTSNNGSTIGRSGQEGKETGKEEEIREEKVMWGEKSIFETEWKISEQIKKVEGLLCAWCLIVNWEVYCKT